MSPLGGVKVMDRRPGWVSSLSDFTIACHAWWDRLIIFPFTLTQLHPHQLLRLGPTVEVKLYHADRQPTKGRGWESTSLRSHLIKQDNQQIAVKYNTAWEHYFYIWITSSFTESVQTRVQLDQSFKSIQYAKKTQRFCGERQLKKAEKNLCTNQIKKLWSTF